MNINRHDNIEKDLRNLRRFQAPLASLESWERLFCLKGLREMPAIDPIPGFGERKIYKARVVPLVFQITDEENCKILLFSRHGIYKSEQELMSLVRERMN